VFVNKPHGPEGWDEKGNRIRMLQEAKKHGNVVLCCDADERFEINFLYDLRKISLQASEKKQKVLALLTFPIDIFKKPRHSSILPVFQVFVHSGGLEGPCGK